MALSLFHSYLGDLRFFYDSFGSGYVLELLFLDV